MIKVLHLPYGWYPDATGGTERYVVDLIDALEPRGVQSSVAVPANSATCASDPEDPVHRVYRLPVDPNPDIAALYARLDPIALKAFKRVLDDLGPDIVHFHSLTAAASPAMIELARHSAQTVLSYHTPTFSCVRGDLMRGGQEPCDGRLDVTRCGACLLRTRGLTGATAEVLARLPSACGRSVLPLIPSKRVTLPLRVRNLVGASHSSFRRAVAAADRIAIFTDWTRHLLALNGLDDEKVVRVRHGVPAGPASLPPPPGPPLRLAFVGRPDPSKGLDLLASVLGSIPETPLLLDVFCPIRPTGPDLAGDSRVTVHVGLHADEIRRSLSRFHLLAVPSRGLETGPLVILEAFAAGIPVLSTRLGGMAELVTQGVDGLLLRPGSVADWADTLASLAIEPARVQKLRSGVKPPPTTADAADDVLAIYQELVGEVERAGN